MKNFFLMLVASQLLHLNRVAAQSPPNPYPLRDILDKGYLIAGTSSAGFSYWYDPPGAGPDLRAYLVEFRPRLAIMFSRCQAIGISATIAKSGGNVFVNDNYEGLGGFWRGYLFMKGRQNLLEPVREEAKPLFPFEKKMNPRARAFIGMSIFPFVEAGFEFANYRWDQRSYTTFPTLSQPQFRAGIGLNLRIWKGLSFEMTYMSSFLPKNPAGTQFNRPGTRIGLDYFIPTRKTLAIPHRYLKTFEHPNRRPPEVSDLNDSLGYAMRLQFGVSYTYIWDTQNDNFKEYTWSFNLAFSPFRRFYAGVNRLQIRSGSDTAITKHARLTGMFVNYNIGQDGKISFVPQVGFYGGNYCTCGETVNPYIRKNMTYFEAGAGFEARITGGLKFEFSFLVYNILDDVPEKYSYTQYILGLNYDLKLRKRR